MVLSAWLLLKRKIKLTFFGFSLKFKGHIQKPLATQFINQHVDKGLPTSNLVPTPVGEGKLTIEHAQLNVKDDKIYIEGDCTLTFSFKGQTLYCAKLQLVFESKLHFYKSINSIGLKDITQVQLLLIDDEYAIAADSLNFIKQILPLNAGENAVKLLGGFNQLLDFASGEMLTETKRYLSMYLEGNKHKILDFHKQDISDTIKRMTQDPRFYYELDPADFAQQLFIQYGNSINANQNQLMCNFSSL
jgi:hypothetical protein